jgi:hypothetical protein
MASVILESLEAEGRGTYLHGKLCFPEWAPEVRERVRNRFASAFGTSTLNLLSRNRSYIDWGGHSCSAAPIARRINHRATSPGNR